MTFKPWLAAKIKLGEKTVTRRPVNDNPRSPWYHGACAYKVGQRVAIQPGRGKPASCYVEILSVTLMALGSIVDDEGMREGFGGARAFEQAWLGMYGKLWRGELVWRLAFKLLDD